ncbi:23S rRNA (uracil(1939)-C(5))-methyltransferase RlmD [Candidatus Chlamydia sanziniae]|uniref:RNA methyltransferase, TrmA family n=1 Tax=Candidatus Chlamydia sanziniae TaxID=1806891 RepID=A0A1A9HX65_9CHLA|nr:23S rRNA (uracil(1939)-C(5))-methyltransferase RlmD [Candidatus Chlamydia sanziniae]ANH78682.1 RNA methyltransferase, TrmA family [Candidatus Chlamydia sanziniae]
MVATKNCIHFDLCGGCSSLQSAYADSLKAKELLLHKLFAFLIPPHSILPVIPCNPPLRGRNKMEFSFFQTQDNKKSLGFISPTKPRQGVSIKECLLIHEDAIEIVKLTRQWWRNYPQLMAYFPPKNTGSLCTLTVRIGNANHELMVILRTSGRQEYAVEPKIIQEWKEILLQAPLNITSIFWEEKQSAPRVPTYYQETLLHGQRFIEQRLSLTSDANSGTFHIGPKSFFQPQYLQAVQIIEVVKNFIDAQGSEILLDLYCGVATIGIMLARYVKKVIGVEIIPDAVESARKNILINQKNGCVEVYLEDVKTFCKKCEQSVPPDIIIMDPPRCGVQNKILKYILRIGAPKLIYISCNPKTQFEECCKLVDNGYEIKKMQPVDQFPHSVHLENIVLLERKKCL